MRIEKLHIQNFGKIHDRTLELSDGLNVFFGKNESGKTTFYHFLKGMFYGLTRKRGKGAGNDEYSRYEPWEHPADYGGTLWFSQNGSRYRLERGFYREAPSMKLLNTSAGKVCDPEELESLLGGISEAVYENTVSIGQLKSVTGPDLTRELTNYMAACQGAADSRINVEKAIQLLKMQRKGFQDQRDHNVRQAEQEIERLHTSASVLQREMEAAQARAQEAERLTEGQGDSRETQHAEAVVDRKQRALERKMQKTLSPLIAGAVLITGGLLLLAGTLIMDWRLLPWLLIAVLAAVIGVLLLAASLSKRKQLKRLGERLALQREKLKARGDQEREKTDRLVWNAERLKEEAREKTAALENLEAELAEQEESAGLPLPEDDQIEAVQMAMDRIALTSGQIRRNLGVRLRERTSEILCEITDGKYREVLVDDKLKITVNTEERLIELEHLSRGTVEQIYFALRMASGELLGGNSDFPVILDDVFGMYDNERLLAVLRWLSEQRRQVILFTCNGREEELLRQDGIPYLRVEL